MGRNGGAQPRGGVVRPVRHQLAGTRRRVPDGLALCRRADHRLSGRHHRVRAVHGLLVSRRAALDLGAVDRVLHRRDQPVFGQGVRRTGVLAVAAEGGRHHRDDRRRAGHHAVRLRAERRQRGDGCA
ncbi:hypothetical protein G6F65_021159 [Rhizopus arrhizus]|nr:hypothetical protein G6F65_021159 [Rhizopus arrhizus]